MNAIEFWSRLVWGGLLVVYSLPIFSERNILAGLASLVTAFLLVLPPIAMRRQHQYPRPLSALKQEFGIHMLLRWSRGLLGVFLCIAGVAVLFSPRVSTYNDKAAAPVFLLLGWLLLSPLSDKLFTFSTNHQSTTGRWRLGGSAVATLLLRSLGLTITILSAALFAIEEASLSESLFCLIFGVALIFVQQSKQLIIGAPKDSQEPVAPLNEAPSIRSIGQPGAPITAPASLPADLPALYKNVSSLPAAEQGQAYANYLYRLFNDQGVSTAGVFTVREAAVHGSFELDGHIYVLAAEWQTEKSDENALLVFNAKVESRSTWARGIFISEAGFTENGLLQFAQGKRTSIIGMDGEDLQLVLEGKLTLTDAIRRKARRAVETNHFFVPLAQLL